jgi:hypothetical protein
VIIDSLSKTAVIDALSDHLAVVETERTQEREMFLDFYEGINMEHYIGKFFGNDTLRQVPMFQQNLTRRVAKARSMAYKRPPKMNAADIYMNMIDLSDLNSKRRNLEALTFLLGTMAFKSKWNEALQKVQYDMLPFFEPMFMKGEQKPFGVVYALQNQGDSRIEEEEFVVWTEEREGLTAKHFGIKGDGEVIHYNANDENPYGLLPVTFCHRGSVVRDWFTNGAEDVVKADLSVSVAMTELALAIRFGAIGIKFITGVDDASRIEIGVDKVLYLPEGSNFGVTAPEGKLSEIIESVKFMVAATLNNNHLRIKWADSHGNAPSGEALRIQELENVEERVGAIEDTWRPWEKQRFDIDKRIIEVKTGKSIPGDYTVDFTEPTYPLSPKDEMMYYDWLWKNGLDTKANYLMSKDPDLTPEMAEEKIRRSEEAMSQGSALVTRLLNNG